MNYKKVFKRLINEINLAEESTKNYGTHQVSCREDIVDYVETKSVLSAYNFVKEIIEEVSGKKWHNINMTQQEFEDWKNEISTKTEFLNKDHKEYNQIAKVLSKNYPFSTNELSELMINYESVDLVKKACKISLSEGTHLSIVCKKLWDRQNY